MELTVNIGELLESDIIKAIESDDKYALTILFINTYNRVKALGTNVKGFYYDSCVACSSEEFDKFSYPGLEYLFNMFNYKTEIIETKIDENDIHSGYMTAKKGNFILKMDVEEGMHDSLYSDFVDAKTAKIV